MRSETKPSQDEEKNGQEPLLPPIQPVIDFGSVVIKNSRAAIHCLTIAGQIEGHMQLPNTQKATKYEHVLPLLAYLEAFCSCSTPSAAMWRRGLPSPSSSQG